MDDEDVQYGGHQLSPNCRRVDLSRVTTRELVYHVAASIAGLRDDFPDRFEHLEQVVQGESNDWKEILEDIGKNLELLQQTLDDCQEGQEGVDGVKALLRIVEDHITDVQTEQDRLAREMLEYASATHSRVDGIKDTISETVDAQTKVLRAEIQALRRTIDQAPRFPQFKKLPVEIRFMIWDLALPRRMVCLKECFEDDQDEFINVQYSFASKLPPPSVAQVCQESRAVACQSGRLVAIRNMKLYPQGRLLPCSRAQWGWFDSSRDSLFLQPSLSHLHPLNSIKDLTSRAQHVTIDYGSSGDHLFNYFEALFSPNYFPVLKAIDIAGETYTQPQRSDAVLEARIFARDCDYPISIEKHNQSARNALLRKLKANHSSDDVDRLERFLEAKGNTDGLPRDIIHYDDEAWNDRQKHLHDRWFIAQYRWDVLGGEDGEGTGSKLVRINGQQKPGLTFDWLVMMHLRMPIIRRVALLRLDGDTWKVT
ncbi:hypothetical protein F4805DRAFT_414552 [Annulohypoxylon moriforme]|nr:hypothetical protein F4805DRAFT_414552 [Annulohypoxylon moriforme]